MGRTVRMLSADGFIQACAIDARDIAQRAHEIHSTSPTASAALGRALAITSLMGGMIKQEGGSATLQFAGGGPGGMLVTVSEANGNVRGCVQEPTVDVPRKPNGKLDVGAYVGENGRLTVIKDLRMREPYVGTVALIGGEIAEDVASYYVESEQIPSAVAAGVLVNPDGNIAAAGAYIIQLLPGYELELIEKLENAVYAAGAVTNMLYAGLTPDEMLEKILAEFDMRIVDEYDACYECDCSRERVERALISTGAEALGEMIDEGKGAEVTCRFCDTIYNFTDNDLRELLKNAKG